MTNNDLMHMRHCCHVIVNIIEQQMTNDRNVTAISHGMPPADETVDKGNISII